MHDRMARKTSLVLVPLAIALAACGLPSKQQRVQEAAYELNMTLKFSAAESTLDKVARNAREKFVARHKYWHNKIKIDDIDIAGISLREDGDANLFLNVGWHRADESDLHSSVIMQHWHDEKGTWLLAEETRSQGDVGLFGEPVVRAPQDDDSAAPARDMQFRTTVIRSSQ
jgi:hypothetical protein